MHAAHMLLRYVLNAAFALSDTDEIRDLLGDKRVIGARIYQIRLNYRAMPKNVLPPVGWDFNYDIL